MANYSIRCIEDEDKKIREAQAFIGEATTSKAFKHALFNYVDMGKRIQKLEADLRSAQYQHSELKGKVSEVKESLGALFGVGE